MRFEEEYESPVLVGEGATAKVYRLKSRANGEYAALKIMADKEIWEQEKDILQKADHQLFPKFIDAGEEDGNYYILMEYIWGDKLSDVLKRHNGLVQQEAMRMALTIADGIGWLQTKENPVIFRDLKADNIIISPEGNVRLVDFGSACGLEKAGDVLTGTIGATAPEQLENGGCLSSDVYAFGRLFHFMLTGDDLGLRPDEKRKTLGEYFEGLSECLELLIEDCLEEDAEKRLPDMYCVTQRMLEIATATPSSYKKMEKAAGREIKNRKENAGVVYNKNIRK